jgi:hypothetical protein
MTDKQKRIVELFKSGKSKYQINKETGASMTYIYLVLERAGLHEVDSERGIKK